MELVLKNFLLSVNGKALSIKDVTAQEVAVYWQWEVDHSPTKSYRTAHNRVTSLFSFLKAHDVSVRWKIPPFDEQLPKLPGTVRQLSPAKELAVPPVPARA